MAELQDKVHELLTYYKDHLYSNLRALQNIEIEYYDDKFKVNWIKDPKKVSRTGAGAELIDDPVEQIAAAKLMAFRPQVGKSVDAEKSAIMVSKFLNENWIRRLMKQSSNPKKEQIKNLFLLGESWIHPVHNQAWVMRPFDKTRLPVYFMIPDPRIIYPSPNEDENGIPEHVLVYYERMPWIVKQKYPAWTDPKASDGGIDRTIEWTEYWDKDDRYFEADGQTVLQTKNPYKVTPFIHKVSGFGKSSNEGKPEDLVVGRIRKYKDLLQRDASNTSDIDSAFHLFAFSPLIITPPEGGDIPTDFNEKFKWEAGNTIENPNRLDISRAVDQMPNPAIFQWYYTIQGQLGRKTPSVLSGAPQGDTGRLQDISYSTAMRKWEGIVSACEDQWATAFSMALKMCDDIPNLMPDEISSKDLNKNYVVEIELRADDPLENDRKAVDGDRKQMNGIIDWETNLIKYQGKTVEEAHEIMDNTIVDTLMKDPIIMRMMALQLAKERGMEEEYTALEAQLQETEGGGGVGSQGGEPREGNVKTPLGREMVDMSQERRPTRMSPA